MKIECKRCLYDEDTPSISFNAEGICNYCQMHDDLERRFPGGEAGWHALEDLADSIRNAGKGKKYDCVVGVSGGCDSSYLVYVVKEKLGLRPLAVHFDNTWNSTVATENINNVLTKLKVDLYTYVVDNKEYDDIYKAFLKAGVPDVDIPTDIALASVLNSAAEKAGVRYVFEGHSFRTEGIAPLGWVYMDGKYVKSVHDKFGTRPLETYPNMLMPKFLKWMVIRRIRKIRPLWHLDYNKEETKKFLIHQFGWKWYGGHHLENRFTAFCHSYFFPKRFGWDLRAIGYSALIRSGQMTRQEGEHLLREEPFLEPELLTYVKKRLGFSDEEFEELMSLPKKYYWDYPTYKKTFERLRPFFWLMMKLNLVPESFYVKYTSKSCI